jgi:hypothetical protein
MAADNVTSIEHQVDQARASYAEAAALYQDNVGALMASGQALMNSCQTMHGTLLAFVQSRAKETLAVSQRLAECGAPQNALEIQLDFARETLQAYVGQFAKCREIAGEALDACARPLQRRAAALSDRASELAA